MRYSALKNFDINKFIIDGKLKFYDRYDSNDKNILFLEEHTEKNQYGDLRIRYDFKEGIEGITGERQEENQYGDLRIRYDFKEGIEGITGERQEENKQGQEDNVDNVVGNVDTEELTQAKAVRQFSNYYTGSDGRYEIEC